MTPAELRALADLVESGKACAEARTQVLEDKEEYLGNVTVAGEQRPTRRVLDTRIAIEVTTFGPCEVFIRDLHNPQGRWVRRGYL